MLQHLILHCSPSARSRLFINLLDAFLMGMMQSDPLRRMRFAHLSVRAAGSSRFERAGCVAAGRRSCWFRDYRSARRRLSPRWPAPAAAPAAAPLAVDCTQD